MFSKKANDSDDQRIQEILNSSYADEHAELAEYLANDTNVSPLVALNCLIKSNRDARALIENEVNNKTALDAKNNDQRIQEILKSPEAKVTGRSEIAELIAFKSDLSSDTAIEILSKIPVHQNYLAQLMENEPNPDIADHEINNYEDEGEKATRYTQDILNSSKKLGVNE